KEDVFIFIDDEYKGCNVLSGGVIDNYTLDVSQ
ncbi:MAG: hypothetical protein RLZ91_1747, partial [Bacteroidota bacterium]